MIETPYQSKKAQAESLHNDIEKFLASGGCIKEIPIGEMTVKEGKVSAARSKLQREKARKRWSHGK